MTKLGYEDGLSGKTLDAEKTCTQLRDIVKMLPLRVLSPTDWQHWTTWGYVLVKTAVPPELEVLTEGKSGSDFMVDCIKSLGFEYIAANPASSFRGLHESLINYGGNKAPELLTCCHEESSVAMAQGYAKIEGKPLCVLAHGTVGLQHASMALYNAWCDRAPVMGVLGNITDAAERRPGIEWYHTALDLVER